MPSPDDIEYEELSQALLCFILFNGGPAHEVEARQTYEPLADFFGLTDEERTRPRPDGYSGSHWQNRIQWTRQRLINLGYLEGRGRGIWALTYSGIAHATSVASRYQALRR